MDAEGYGDALTLQVRFEDAFAGLQSGYKIGQRQILLGRIKGDDKGNFKLKSLFRHHRFYWGVFEASIVADMFKGSSE